MNHRPGIALIATQSFYQDPAGPFLSLVRAYSESIRRFEVHATRGTALAMLATGEFTCDEPSQDSYHVPTQADVRFYPPGRHGGVVRIAALLPVRRCEAVLFFNDPTDPSADVPENRALERLCKELGVRLVSTFDGARHWFEYEADSVIRDFSKRDDASKDNHFWGQGQPNVHPESGRPLDLTLGQQTLALIAHDRRKEDMLLFVNLFGQLLQRYERVLTTGTTGFTLKLVFSSVDQVASVLQEAYSTLREERFHEFLGGAAKVAARYNLPGGEEAPSVEYLRTWLENCPPNSQVNGLELVPEIEKWIREGMPRTAETPAPVLEQSGLHPLPQLVNKILPVSSGPKGGDVILANEVLSHTCHAAVFFQDPQRAHAHDPDIRLFERACHFWPVEEPRSRVHITCVSDPISAINWAKSLVDVDAEMRISCSRPEELSRGEDWGLHAVVLIDRFLERTDSISIGKALAEAGARYLLKRIGKLLSSQEKVTVAVGHGETLERLVEMVDQLKGQECFGLDPERLKEVVSLPLTGTVSGYALPRQATTIANHLAAVFGGKSQPFLSPGLIEPDDEEKIPDADRFLIGRTERADVITVAVGLYEGAIETAHPVEFREDHRDPVGIVSSNVIDHTGRAMERVRVPVGLRLDGLRRAAERKAVVALCAGPDAKRRQALRCLLDGRLVSVLITDSKTVDWLREQQSLFR